MWLVDINLLALCSISHQCFLSVTCHCVLSSKCKVVLRFALTMPPFKVHYIDGTLLALCGSPVLVTAFVDSILFDNCVQDRQTDRHR